MIYLPASSITTWVCMASSLVGDSTNIIGLLGTRGIGLSYLK